MLKEVERKFNLQFFAEGDPLEGAGKDEGTVTGEAEPSKKPPTGTLFSEDYVRSLRSEAAGYRVQLQSLRKSLKDTLGIEVGDDPTESLTKFKDQQTGQINSAIAKAQDFLLKGATDKLKVELGIKDIEVAMGLVDKTKIKVGENGEVEGLKEQLEAVLEAKPYLKDTTPAPVGGNPARGTGGSSDDSVAKAMAMAQQRNQRQGSSYDPWKGQSPTQPQDISEALASAIGNALKNLNLGQ